ncbi:MAG: DUF6364 family protein [Spiribacter sp.]|nr:DUF6364 family protein [Spiribacter sp.]
MVDTAKLTIRLPREDVEFIKSYAKAHRLTVTEVIDRSLRQMRSEQAEGLSPEIATISGILRNEHIDEESHKAYLERKHR